MSPIAHIGKVPVEEWLPFLVPVLALFVYGRHRNRRRRAAVAQLPQASEALDEATLNRVLARWSAAGREGLGPQHVALFYPPGPDARSAAELAARVHADPVAVARLLEELEDLGYLELEDRGGFDGRRAWLTFEGYELLYEAEAALLSST